jgi:hypothetical protein
MRFLAEHKSVEVEHDLELTRGRLEAKIEECCRREREARDLDERLATAKNKILSLEETNSR